MYSGHFLFHIVIYFIFIPILRCRDRVLLLLSIADGGILFSRNAVFLEIGAPIRRNKLN